MGWPQITMVVLMALGLGISLAKHGEPREPYSFGTALLGTALAAGLLWAGGFFA
jgi:hypothetical protein